ncbi:protein of unknown function [Candidatus Promineifilum breve]|uniref:Uncharacterized protein n=1 Tax=Candidatus Promineifilum breve TaxID=1806508 RepID=A0A160T0B7_9CHLR|nr:protein of unknown function [Candidatus Promineifilum breve]
MPILVVSWGGELEVPPTSCFVGRGTGSSPYELSCGAGNWKFPLRVVLWGGELEVPPTSCFVGRGTGSSPYELSCGRGTGSSPYDVVLFAEEENSHVEFGTLKGEEEHETLPMVNSGFDSGHDGRGLRWHAAGR